ncbi:MAG: ribosomal protein S18-alanine N-acetyltransferase [Pseudobutyrivibrio sp.]|nr:ribosomal protein S18-alanine N-acetyltransferase [Pseudobutyrivibrio sp.]
MIIFRKVHEEELAVIADIEKRVMPQPWSLSSFKTAFDSQSGSIYVAIDDTCDTIAGFVVIYIAADEGEIPDVVVDFGYRRQGIAQRLLLYVFEQNQELTSVFLEVRESNKAAKKLYSKLGFSQIGIRKNFYINPVENAICMSLHK